jgi:hypothetical protein
MQKYVHDFATESVSIAMLLGRYATQITPVNYNLLAVNLFM